MAPKTEVFVYQPPDIADQADDEEAFPRTLHAKAYVFRGRPADPIHAWLGSANFTAQALTKTVAKGGNVELLVRTTLPRDEAGALDDDLAAVFRSGGDIDDNTAPDDAPRPRPVATILGCELVMSSKGPRLVVHSLLMQGQVVLVNGKHRCRVVIKRGRGVVEGAALHKLLPDLDVSAPRTLVLHQLVRGTTVPVVVNVPHVPPDDEPGHASQASVDALLDDWLGRVPVRDKPDEAEEPDSDDGDEDGDDEQDDDDDDELERRLDDVRHQGEIDQLAVKAALLKRLVVRATPKGAARDGTLADVLAALVAASPRHLAPALRRLFDDLEPRTRP